VRRSLDPLEDLVGLDRKLKDLDKRLKTAVAATATTLTDIKGVGRLDRDRDRRDDPR